MIKFIATDLDGTLLKDDKTLPEEIFGLIGQLRELGILFAPASGRQYANIRNLFAPVKDSVIFICENGALVKYREETLRLDPIPEEALKPALDRIRGIEYLHPMLCGEDFAYIDSDVQPFLDYSMRSYDNCRRVDCLDSVLGAEKICKIAVFDEIGSEHCISLLPKRLPGLKTILSGMEWCDVTAPAVDKGAAIKFVREKFSLKREECAAFGDHMNDRELLLACGHPFVPENAYPQLKRQFPHIVPSNEEGGVLQKIKEILEKGGNL